MSYERMLTNKPEKGAKTGGEREPIEIIRCNCTSSFQDAAYGKNNRVFNPTHKVDSMAKKLYRCTVCKTERRK